MIALVVLLTGENLAAEINEKEIGGHSIKLKRPVFLLMHPQEGIKPVHWPFMASHDGDDEVIVNSSAIVTIARLQAGLEAMYKQVTGSIVVPEKKLIV